MNLEGELDLGELETDDSKVFFENTYLDLRTMTTKLFDESEIPGGSRTMKRASKNNRERPHYSLRNDGRDFQHPAYVLSQGNPSSIVSFLFKWSE